jgi:hypothetical protein
VDIVDICNSVLRRVVLTATTALNALTFAKTSANISHAFVKAVLERDEVSVVILSENFIGGES